MNFEIGKLYKTRGGDKVMVVDITDKTMDAYNYTRKEIMRIWSNGKVYLKGQEHTDDIISEWKEPMVFECWINCYIDRDGFGYCIKYDTPEHAKIDADRPDNGEPKPVATAVHFKHTVEV